MKKEVERLFKYVIECVYDQAGDGWGLIVSNNYKELADLFEEYEKQFIKWPHEREDDEDSIRFVYYNEETIRFAPKYDSLDEWEDIVVIVNNILQ